jgi:hypothetical protein
MAPPLKIVGYSDVQVNSTIIDRSYLGVKVEEWQDETIPLFAVYYIDAQTGDIIPHVLFFSQPSLSLTKNKIVLLKCFKSVKSLNPLP